jgi:hypothetical protein
VGDGEDGGVDNIREKFLYLREVLSTDNLDSANERILAIVLMDNDRAGRTTSEFLEKRGFKINRDVFLMTRIIPRKTTDAYQLGRVIGEANASWRHLDCEVEDLLSRELLQYFAEAEPSCVAAEPRFADTGHHFEWTRDGKTKLLRFVGKEASYDDVVGIVELLRSLRFLLGLDEDGA